MSFNFNLITGGSPNGSSARDIKDLIDFSPFNDSYIWTTFELSVLILFTVTSFIGNGSIVYTIFRRRSLHRQYYVFILNMAFVNFICAACSLPLSIVSSILHDWPFGKLFCRASAWINFSLCIECLGTLIMVHIDRILAVYFPLWYSRLNMKPRNVFRGSATLIVGSWAVSLCLSMGLWVLEHAVHYDFLRLACLPHFIGQTNLILSGIAGISIMVVIMTVLQFVATHQHIRRIAQIVPTTTKASCSSPGDNTQETPGNQPTSSHASRDLDAENTRSNENDPNRHVMIPRVHQHQAIMGVAATCIVLVTWLPFVVGIYWGGDMDHHIVVFTAVLWYTTGVLLFFLFAFFERKVRKELFRHCGCTAVLWD